MIVPGRDDHVAAAEIRNTCRRKGVQIGTIDALLIQLCCRHELTMLATDQQHLAPGQDRAHDATAKKMQLPMPTSNATTRITRQRVVSNSHPRIREMSSPRPVRSSR
jgi:hypothetical protein